MKHNALGRVKLSQSNNTAAIHRYNNKLIVTP